MERSLSKIAQQTDSKANILWATYRWKKIGSQPKKRFKDCLKQTFKKSDINSVSWETQAQNSLTWRKVSFEATGRFEESRRKHARLKLDLRTGNITEHVTELTCGHCGRPCLSRAGFLSHLRFHRRRVPSAKHEKVSSVHTTRQNAICPMPYSNICNIYGKICKCRWRKKVHIFNTLTYPSIPNLFIYLAIVRCASLPRV